ncbi:MAG: lytic transglycosylase domain-containing protein [Bacteroidia bacterium]|nr:lytic transglycosylase domain-containing protein [Bacteroidia bacterium]
MLTFWAAQPEKLEPQLNSKQTKAQQLFLISEARPYLQNQELFARKVNNIAHRLEVPTSWIMAVMYSESKFNSTVYNYKGSGAVGLIQFMPSTAKELGISSYALSQMSPCEQLPYVESYFQRVKDRYGPYTDLADFYLAVLYPKARNQDHCFALYAKPSKAYRQNSGLDENKDGIVSVSDIHLRMKRLFPTAYMEI